MCSCEPDVLEQPPWPTPGLSLYQDPKATLLALALAKGLLGINLSFIFVILKEEQKGKKKKNTKKKLSAPNASRVAQEGSSPEPKLESQASSLTDHEYTAGASTFGVAQPNRGSQPMAPGVFLTQRRPSSSSQNNGSAKGTRKRLAHGAGVGKGEGPCTPASCRALCVLWACTGAGVCVPGRSAQG